jgi:ABC-type hemin transport system ATPase subunit
MLTATDLVFQVDGRKLIDHVSARFERERLHLIMGAHGAGKSTSIKLLARLIPPDHGGVLHDDGDVPRWSERDLAQRRAVLSQAVEVAFDLALAHARTGQGEHERFDSTGADHGDACLDAESVCQGVGRTIVRL